MDHTGLVEALRAMPPLPLVAQRVLQLVRDPDYSVDDLVALVRTDPALTGRILQLCNSAAYALRSAVSSVGAAVAYIGIRNLVRIALACCTAPHYRKAQNSPYASPGELWRHTFAVALAAQWCAQRCGHDQADAAFTAGVLHNLGKVVLSQAYPEVGFAEGPPATDHLQMEQRLFGIDHAAAAAVVVDSWGLPRDLRRAVRSHHDPAAVQDESPLPAILQAADVLVLQQGIGNPFPSIPLRVEPAVLGRLHLEEADLAAAAAHVHSELQRSVELLNLEGLASR
ncbi:MAG: HDOD domain-containing protein [Planctomycetes bacterium]|nr:HDOD domain-containing protein [Planctomycetota bacterium]